jgi:N-acylneuraminate cytidylyltransferase
VDPLFEVSVKQGFAHADRVILSTDISQVICGQIPTSAEIHKRSDSTASDLARMEEVVMEVIEDQNLHETNIVLLQPTSPLRNFADIRGAMELFSKNRKSLIVSCCLSENTVLKTILLVNGKYSAINEQQFLFENRQNLPHSFEPNGSIFIFNSKIFSENGFTGMQLEVYEMPKERSVDIDNFADFEFVKSALSNA